MTGRSLVNFGTDAGSRVWAKTICPVMASPITNSLATRWIQNGTLNKVRDHQRQLSRQRQQLAKQQLAHLHPVSNQDGFHLWLPLPKHLNVNPSDVAVFLRNHGISAVSSAAFCTDNNPPDAIRMCLGGPVGINELAQRLNLLQEVLQENSNFALI